jgi:integrase
VEGVKKDGLQKYRVRINYTSSTGKSASLTRVAYGKEAASDLEARLTTEYKGGNSKAPAKKMKVQTLYDTYMEAKRDDVKVSTFEKCQWTLERYVLPTFRDVRIDRLNTENLLQWKLSINAIKTEKQTQLSLSSRQHIYNDFNTMLNFAVMMEYLPRNPLKLLGNFVDVSTVRKEMDYYTSQEFKQFMRAAKKFAQDKESNSGNLSEWDYFIFFAIAFHTGLRKGEIHALKWSDLEGKFLFVRRSIMQVKIGADRETPPKNKSSYRRLEMPLPLIKVLEEHKKRQQKHLKNFTDDYRVCGGEACLRDSSIYNRNELYAATAGIKRIRVHDFRHSHVSVLANNRINIQEIARRLGHAKIEITWNRYSHLYPQEEERAVDILNDIVI